MADIRYSIDEKSLRETFPELLYEDASGNVSVNYIEMIPLLVQSIKELQSQIDELRGTNGKKQSYATSITDEKCEEVYTLSQNHPNPFTESTDIELYIPESTKTACILIYNLKGIQVQQLDVSERGKVIIKVIFDKLETGIYLYSLIADGVVISTKRMIHK